MSLGQACVHGVFHDRPKKGIRHSYATNRIKQRESNIDRKQYRLLNTSMQNASCSFLGMEEPSSMDHLHLHHVSQLPLNIC